MNSLFKDPVLVGLSAVFAGTLAVSMHRGLFSKASVPIPSPSLSSAAPVSKIEAQNSPLPQVVVTKTLPEPVPSSAPAPKIQTPISAAPAPPVQMQTISNLLPPPAAVQVPTENRASTGFAPLDAALEAQAEGLPVSPFPVSVPVSPLPTATGPVSCPGTLWTSLGPITQIRINCPLSPSPPDPGPPPGMMPIPTQPGIPVQPGSPIEPGLPVRSINPPIVPVEPIRSGLPSRSINSPKLR